MKKITIAIVMISLCIGMSANIDAVTISTDDYDDCIIKNLSKTMSDYEVAMIKNACEGLYLNSVDLISNRCILEYVQGDMGDYAVSVAKDMCEELSLTESMKTKNIRYIQCVLSGVKGTGNDQAVSLIMNVCGNKYDNQ